VIRTTPPRISQVLKVLDSVTPFQDVCYVILVAWSVYSILVSPVTPVTQNMSAYIVVPYTVTGLIAPLISMTGQAYTLGWVLRWGGDVGVTCTLVVALLSFLRATGEPSAILAGPIIVALLWAAALLVTRDILKIVQSVCRRRRSLGVADES
jgi:hypothetical protein